ncbi:50S ribosomal protein L11 methyltransferase [Virgibacillus sp. NKC19-16]|uniref:50S ribosomal protein L11 methyltransferase n=1 Tax=Virgibacillus salidurans TaxID=2831673 RepID=UPI001F42C541|nr:50S ribosomal protein L11 methyltransferase [Virgibacillus sp. NKC19-16]UJL44884.1 50S ribosomal protein L11 methyltransferase [Virgibacillus sp. NKC19-16]
MKWSEICIHTTNEAIEPISNILDEIGASGLVIEDPLDLVKERDTFFGEVYELNPNEYPQEGVYIKAYLPAGDRLDEVVERIKQDVTNLKNYAIDIGKNHVTSREINEEDWANAWKKYYKPIHISDKVTIIPTWEEYTPISSDEIIIELDPGMAFGTGTHPTTILSIRALEKYIKKADVVIDVGSGSGVLSIASSLLGAGNVYAYDLDDVAVKSTKVNAELNKLDKQIEAKQNNLLNQVNMKADVIVSNILAEIIIQFVDDAWQTLEFGGLFIMSGIIQTKEQIVKDKLEQQGFEILEVNMLEDWISITARKV